MATPTNPLTGPLDQGAQQNPAMNPLLGWLGQTGTNQLSPLPQASPVQTPQTGPFGNPSGRLENPFTNIKDMLRNAQLMNVILGQQRSQLAPQFANQMFGYAQPAAQFFRTLMDLGGPFYQQKQRQSFEQGTQRGQEAASQAREQLNARGFGYTPSGAGAAMIGGMGQAQAGNLATQFLTNLFQNEQLQLAGAQGLSGLAGMFNPSQLLSGGVPTSASTQGPSFLDFLGQAMGAAAKAYAGPGG